MYRPLQEAGAQSGRRDNMKCVVCEEKLDNTVQHSFCPTCGFPVFRALDNSPMTAKHISEAAARCRDAWIGGTKLRIVIQKYKKTPAGLTGPVEEKIPAGVYRELSDHQIHWLHQPFASIKTKKEISIDLIAVNGNKKCMVSVPMMPPSATGVWHVGISQAEPGYLRLHLDDGTKIVESGRIGIQMAGLKPSVTEKPAG